MMLPQNYNVAFKEQLGKVCNFNFRTRVTIKMQIGANSSLLMKRPLSINILSINLEITKIPSVLLLLITFASQVSWKMPGSLKNNSLLGIKARSY